MAGFFPDDDGSKTPKPARGADSVPEGDGVAMVQRGRLPALREGCLRSGAPPGERSGSIFCAGLVTVPVGVIDAAVSPDGTKVAFVTQTNFHHVDCPKMVTHPHLWVANVDGTNLVEIKDSAGSEEFTGPSWTTNSRLLLND